MASLPTAPDPEGRVLHGCADNEDAVIVAPPPAGKALVQTVDVLAPLGNDPVNFGRTAAANALSDVYAMGGEAWCAMNIVTFPASELPLSILSDILRGGLEKVAEAGAVPAGGHTLDGDEIKYGLAVTGIVDPAAATRNNGLRPGDVLVLTKPLGSGVLATAVKAGWPESEAHEAEMYRWTTRLNRNAARVIRDMGLRAATDVTGFGLGGHVLEMARASHVRVELAVASLPFMAGVLDLAADGLIPEGSYANRRHCACRTRVVPEADELAALLAFDAQTSGGLLLAVRPERAEEACARLAEQGEPSWVVGRVSALPDDPDEARMQLILA